MIKFNLDPVYLSSLIVVKKDKVKTKKEKNVRCYKNKKIGPVKFNLMVLN